MTTTYYDRPSLSDLQSRIATDLSSMPDILRGPLTKAWAAACHGEHGHLDWVARQISPLTCDIDMLHEWAYLYDVQRLLATAAQGDVTVTGNVGTALLTDTLARGQNGHDYRVVAGAVVGDDGTASVRVRCEDTGADTDMAAGQILTLIDPVAGIDNTLTVGLPGLTGGADDESVDDWRSRVVDSWQTMTRYGAKGGRDSDYKKWAKDAHPSVSDALVYRNVLGYGTVLVMPICNDLPSRLPTQAVLAAVTEAICGTAPDYNGQAPATVDVSVVSPVPVGVQVKLQLSADDDTQSVRDAITGALTAAVLAESGESAVLMVSEVDAAISAVTNQYVRLAPTSDIAVGQGQVLVLSPIEWVTA